MSEFDAALITKISAPTLVLHAPDDTLVVMAHAEHAAKNVPSATLVTMAKGGHLAFMLNMNAGARGELKTFLERYNK